MPEYRIAKVPSKDMASSVTRLVKRLGWDDLLSIRIRLLIDNELNQPASFILIVEREESHDLYAMQRQVSDAIRNGQSDVYLYTAH